MMTSFNLVNSLASIVSFIVCLVIASIYFFFVKKFDPRAYNLGRARSISNAKGKVKGKNKRGFQFFLLFFLLIGSSFLIHQTSGNLLVYPVLVIAWLGAVMVLANKIEKNSFEENGVTESEQKEIKKRYSKLRLAFSLFLIILLVLLYILFNTNNPIINLFK